MRRIWCFENKPKMHVGSGSSREMGNCTDQDLSRILLDLSFGCFSKQTHVELINLPHNGLPGRPRNWHLEEVWASLYYLLTTRMLVDHHQDQEDLLGHDVNRRKCKEGKLLVYWEFWWLLWLLRLSTS